jgi:hypothetical protein
MEINEGHWGRSEGHIGSVTVRCMSIWLLHFNAARFTRSASQLDLNTAQLGNGLLLTGQPGIDCGRDGS